MEGLTIKTIPFIKEEIDKIKTDYNVFNDYPIIYTLHKEKEAYIGETVNAFNRLHNHRLIAIILLMLKTDMILST